MIGMAMEDATERLATSHRARREQERERRRMRDRQRRQSMTLEQKEKHLARRRRNYQLRRERKHQGSDHQSGQTDTAAEQGNTEQNNRQMDHCVSQYTVQYDHAVPVGFNQVLQNISAESLRSNSGTESLTYDLAKIQKRLRLIHVKHFARSLKRPLGELTSSNIPIVANLILKGTTEANSMMRFCIVTDMKIMNLVTDSRNGSCELLFDILASVPGKSMTGVRLNRLKRLARTANSAPNEASEKNNHDETQGQQKPERAEAWPNGDEVQKMLTDSVAVEDKKCSDIS